MYCSSTRFTHFFYSQAIFTRTCLKNNLSNVIRSHMHATVGEMCWYEAPAAFRTETVLLWALLLAVLMKSIYLDEILIHETCVWKESFWSLLFSNYAALCGWAPHNKRYSWNLRPFEEPSVWMMKEQVNFYSDLQSIDPAGEICNGFSLKSFACFINYMIWWYENNIWNFGDQK